MFKNIFRNFSLRISRVISRRTLADLIMRDKIAEKYHTTSSSASKLINSHWKDVECNVNKNSRFLARTCKLMTRNEFKTWAAWMIFTRGKTPMLLLCVFSVELYIYIYLFFLKLAFLLSKHVKLPIPLRFAGRPSVLERYLAELFPECWLANVGKTYILACKLCIKGDFKK